MEKRQPVQTVVIVYRKTPGDGLLVLALRRTEAWGGFWQPVTGGVREGETLQDAAWREVQEETGIARPRRFFDMDYRYTFRLPEKYKIFYDDDVEILTEHAFGYETDIADIILSDEHNEYRWLTPPEAFELYEYPEYSEALRRVMRFLGRA